MPVLAASVAVLPVQGVIGAVWAAKADNIAVAGLALRSGGGDEEWMATRGAGALLNGEPIEVQTEIDISFELGQ